MSYESMSRNLMNYSMNGYVLNILESGNEVSWEQYNGETLVSCTSWYLDFDMLSGFDFLREVMQTETLIISWTSFNTFEAELSHKKRAFGFDYKEPLQKEVYDSVYGYSILDVIGLLNKRIEKSRQEADASLELIKK